MSNPVRVTITPAAREDLREIRKYLARHNREGADRAVRGIRDRIKLLGRHPRLGQKRDAIAPDLRNFPSGDYVIFYRIDETGVLVLRILHGARDAEAQF